MAADKNVHFCVLSLANSVELLFEPQLLSTSSSRLFPYLGCRIRAIVGHAICLVLTVLTGHGVFQRTAQSGKRSRFKMPRRVSGVFTERDKVAPVGKDHSIR